MAHETKENDPCCGDCTHGEFNGSSPTGQCGADFKLPYCVNRFVPRVGYGTIRAVDYHMDGVPCALFERRQ